jgi:zinc/manganese transport system ATP-binding protein
MRQAADGPALRFSNVTLGYDRHPAVHHLDGAVGAGGLLALVGPNGAGKSTLLKGVVGQIRPFEGRIERAAGPVAYMPQQAEIDRSFPISVFDMMGMGLWREIGLSASFGARRERAVAQALAAVGLAGFERRPIGSLSGGQFQRVLFGRLMLQDARLILLDEPFAAIDSRTTADLMTLVLRWHGEGRTVLAALHDLDQVRAHFPETLLLAREAVAWGPTGEVLTTANLFRARHLCEAWDEHAEICARGEHELQRSA